jgi:hypothetical protein
MKEFLLIIAVVFAIAVWLACLGAYQAFKAHSRHYGTVPVLWRWFSGQHHHAREPYPNMARYQNRDMPLCRRRLHPRFRRIIYRLFWVVFIPWAAFAWFYDSPLTWAIFATACAGLFTETIHHHQITHSMRSHHRTWVVPLHHALKPVIKAELPDNPNHWIYVAPDRKKATAILPRHYNPPTSERERVGQIMRETTEMDESATVTWKLGGTSSHVEVVDRQPPPKHVTIADIMPEIDKVAEKEGRNFETVVLGLGRGGDPVKVSLAEDSPHLGLSIGPGGGKSQFARLMAAQVLHRGGVVLFLDPKRISHAWARGLPNVYYAKTDEEIYEGLLRLSREVDRRTRLADVTSDVEGEVFANLGPRWLVVFEEQNEGLSRQRRLWASKRNPKKDPQKSPAVVAYEEALFMGRQIEMNMMGVAQMMTALAAGSGAARECMGIRVLGRYSRNNWRMLCPEFEMPDRSMHPGRVQVVTTDVKECQVAFMTGAEARAYAMSGIVTAFPSEEPVTDPEAPMITDGSDLPVGAPARERHDILDADIVVDDTGTFRELLPALPVKSVNVLNNDRARDPDFPRPLREHRTGNTYSLQELIDYYGKRRGNE